MAHRRRPRPLHRRISPAAMMPTKFRRGRLSTQLAPTLPRRQLTAAQSGSPSGAVTRSQVHAVRGSAAPTIGALSIPVLARSPYDVWALYDGQLPTTNGGYEVRWYSSQKRGEYYELRRAWFVLDADTPKTGADGLTRPPASANRSSLVVFGK